jgi:Flp pilus assembly protein TadB
LVLSTTAFAGPGKKHHNSDRQLNHEQAIPGLALEDDAILISTSPILEEKAMEEAATAELNTTPSSATETNIHLTERVQNRVNKAEQRLQRKMEKLEKKPHRTLWNSAGTRWIIIGLIFLLGGALFYIFPGLGLLGALCSLIGVVLIIVGLLMGVDAI